MKTHSFEQNRPNGSLRRYGRSGLLSCYFLLMNEITMIPAESKRHLAVSSCQKLVLDRNNHCVNEIEEAHLRYLCAEQVSRNTHLIKLLTYQASQLIH